MSAFLTAILTTGFVVAAIRMMTPILLAALGDLYAERTGVMNIGLESMMLIGAFVSFVAAWHTGNVYLAVLITIVCGVVLGLFHAFMTVSLRCNQVVTAVAENIFALGVTSVLNRFIFGAGSNLPECPVLPSLNIPGLSSLPVAGEIFFQHNILVYFSILAVILTSVIIFKTTFGLRLRAVGEHPQAADTLGIRVYVTRYICIVISGMMAALGGACLTIGGLGRYMDNMTAGRGFIALAAVIFGRYNPGGVLLAALLFGITDAFQLRMQASGIGLPHQLFLMLPYLITLIVLVVFMGPSTAPRSMGKPYVREER
ncbi:MAG: ABC transporter permease [Bacillota bacterium]